MWNGIAFNKRFLTIVLVLFVQVVLMSIAAGFGNNTGRIFYFTSPIILIFVLLEASTIVVKKV
jgi:hypothetical protein